MLIDLLDEAGGAADAVALVGEDEEWTYAELDTEVSGRARELRADGVGERRVVALPMDATAQAVIELLALWRVGVTPAPLNSSLTPHEREAAERALSGAPPGAQAVLWTSGTEGRPRGVAISYRNLAASALASRQRLDLGPEDVWLASLSPAHVGGLALITRAILLGSTLVAVGPFDAERTVKLLESAGSSAGPVTHVSVVPTQLLRLLDASADRPPPDTFRCALVGGARAPTDLVVRALDAGWPVALTYGLTEATSQVATAPPELTARKPGTVGRPLEGVDVRLSDEGEIHVRGATVAAAYVGVDDRAVGDRAVGDRAVDDARVVGRAVDDAPVVDVDGWFHTGDLGSIDDDGDLWVTGRRADRIVTGGVTVDAVEVEEAIRSHPRVADACVVGVQDAEWGERVGAWVVPDGALEVDELDAFLRERLSGPKLPRAVHVGEHLPRNANGKVDRVAVREVVATSLSDTTA